MQLIIAEKPKMAKAIARAIGAQPDPKQRGAYDNGDYRVVSCQGHILEQFSPDQYDERYQRWRLEDLPIRPNPWKMGIIKDRGRYITMIREGMKRADAIIQAADPDPEGQLLVDEVLHFLGWTGTTYRLVVTDLNPKPIQKAMQNLQDNNSETFQGMYRKALARSRGDWLLGMNLTRLYTIMGRKFGIDHVLSAGRVQSAVLGLVVRRDLAIEDFVPHDYFAIQGEFAHDNGRFSAKWQPAKGQAGLDDEGRLIESQVAEALKQLAPDQAHVVEHEVSKKRQRPPKPYTMAELQKEGSRKFGLTMAETLAIAQALYDKHEIITYPRTDSGYLPEDQHAEAPNILAAIAANLRQGDDFSQGADPSRKSTAFNNAKVKAHHGIVPTAKASPETVMQLTESERCIYELICRRYAAQFYPDALYNATRVVAQIANQGERFKATGRQWLEQGWRVTLPVSGKNDDEEDEQEAEDPELPPMQQGDTLALEAVDATQKTTTPPKHFTDATLLEAMTNIHRYVEDAGVKSLLKEGDGIGTEATRADILEKLISHKLMQREKKLIKSTPSGKVHYRLMPGAITSPDMAGVFEHSTRCVEDASVELEDFLNSVEDFVKVELGKQEEWEQRAQSLGLERPKAKPCRNCEAPLAKLRSRKTKKTFFACRECDSMFQDNAGAPGHCFAGPLKESDDAEREAKHQERLKHAPPCPECESPILRYKSKSKRHYWRCDSCNSLFQDHEGKIGSAFKLRGESVTPAADGPPCPECEAAMQRATTKKKKPILICRACDTMCWSDDGAAGKVFKRRGEMVGRETTAAS